LEKKEPRLNLTAYDMTLGFIADVIGLQPNVNGMTREYQPDI